MTLRIAWFATARGTSSRLLFERAQRAIAAGELNAEIVVVFCNRDRGQSANTDAFLDTVDASGVPLVTLSSNDWRTRVDGETWRPGQPLPHWRHDFDTAAAEAIAPYAPDVGVLAGYMLVTTAALCERLPLLNLHPAEPDGPVGTWQEVIRALITERAAWSGMMLQRATVDLDRGPVVTFARYPIQDATTAPLWDARASDPTAPEEDDPLFQAIRKRGVVREPIFVVQSLRAIADGRVPIPPAGTDGPTLDISADVEAALQTALQATGE